MLQNDTPYMVIHIFKNIQNNVVYYRCICIIKYKNRKDTHQIYDDIGFESRKEGLWNWEGEQWKVNFIRNALFFLFKKKVLRETGQNVNICPFSLVSIFSLEILNIPFLN